MALGRDTGSFERDFGYLLPFIDRVEQAGAQLATPGAREELGRLLSGERARWVRIRELLAGAPGNGAMPPGELAPVRSQQKAATLNESAGPGLTVGPLKSR